MRALILEEPGVLSLRQDLPVPEPKGADVLVRVKAAPTCGTDLKAYLRGHPQIPMPGVFGHEYSGVVEAAGPHSEFAAGQAVMGVHSAPCGHCPWCLDGQDNLCESLMSSKVLGSFAEFLLIPERIARLNLFSKPEGLSFALAGLLEPLSCVAQGLRDFSRLRSPSEGHWLVLGPGAIGLMFVAVLRMMGCRKVTLSGRNRSRLEVGERLGAHSVLLDDLPTDGAGADAVVECTGSAEIWERGVDLVRRGGAVLLFGGPPSGSRVSFATSRLHYDQISLMSPFHFGVDAVRTARQWLLGGNLDLRPLISGSRTLEEGPAVFESLRAGEGIKYVFEP